MKKNLHRISIPLLLSVILSTSIYAQVTHSTFNHDGAHLVNFQERALYEKSHPQPLQKMAVEQGEDRGRYKFKPKPVPAGAIVSKVDLKPIAPAAQAQTVFNSPNPILNVNGILDNGTVIPPDINGAVGKNFVMETTNQAFNIYTKTGTLTSSVTLGTFFSATGGKRYFDPHIVYDPSYDRFVISADGYFGPNDTSALFLAVSQTGDPTGNWYVYGIDPHLQSPGDFLDYPQLGFNNSWVVITVVDFPVSGFSKSKIYVLNRTSVYSGAQGTINVFSDSSAILQSPAAIYDASQNTEYLVANWNGNSGGNGYVRLSAITGTASSPTYAIGSTIGVNQPWNDGGLGGVNATQPGSFKLVEDGDSRIHSCIYRGGSLWLTHTIFLPAASPTCSGVDWWQINPAAGIVTQFGRIADPAGKVFYYYPSLDVNTNGDMLIGYNFSGPGNYVSAAYALRLSGDAAGTLEVPVTFKAGVAGYFKDYGSGRNRWGDFSGTAFDPSDNSFWTFQEWANTGNNWATQIAHMPDSAGPLLCLVPTGTTTGSITDTSATFSWAAVPGATRYNVQYRPYLSSTWTTVSTTSTSYAATGLTLGTNYEWQVQTVCSYSSAFSPSVIFTTTGGCPWPLGLTASSITDTGAILSWQAVTGATTYNLQWITDSVDSWITVSGLTTNSYHITGLQPCTGFAFKVQSVCSSGSSAYSDQYGSRTTGCYCISRALQPDDYIKTVVLKAINHTTTGPGGYTNFTTSVQTSLAAGCQDTIQLTPGFTGSSSTEYWTVYIDYNQNHVFDPGEIVATGSFNGTVTSVFTVPLTAKTGPTRMRIQMHRGFSITDPCALMDFGDVHDYTVVITGGTASCPVPAGLTVSSITDTGAILSWGTVTGATYNLQWITDSVDSWTTVPGLTTNSYNFNGNFARLQPCTGFAFKVQSVNSFGSSAYSDQDNSRTTGCYCTSSGLQWVNDYIKTVVLKAINHTTVADGGYTNYTTSVQTSLAAGSQDTIQLTPGSSGSPMEYWTVYIDYNQNHVFDPDEIVATNWSTGTTANVFTVPATAKNGPTRMRIQMHRGSGITDPCALMDFGDVHDYTVVITGGTASVAKAALSRADIQDAQLKEEVSLQVIPNPVPGSSAPTAVYKLAGDGNTSLKVVDMNGRILQHVNLGIQNAGPHNYLLTNRGGSLRSGYYILILEQNGQAIARTRFIVRQ